MTKFISFYSYKGGVGRTLSLINVSAALAKMGKSVLIWDLDLEAPGIQTIPLLNRLGIEDQIEKGMIDILLDFQDSGFQLLQDDAILNSIYRFKPGKSDDIYKPLKNIKILPAGKLDKDYSAKYSRVKWNELFKGTESVGFQAFEKCYQVIQNLGPDFVMVDSRTGLTHIALVTTIQLPDLVYLVFNYNEQNLRGLHSIHSALMSDKIQGEIRKYPLTVKTIVSMVDTENIELHKKRKKRLEEVFNIKPHYEIPIHKPLMMEEVILTLKDDLRSLEATRKYYEIARDIIDHEPERFAAENHLFKSMSRDYKEGKSFEEKVADIFKLMGYEVELNKRLAGNEIDLFIKKKKRLSNKYEYYICECKTWAQKVGRDVVNKFSGVINSIQKELQVQGDKTTCEGIIVSSFGFTNEAKKAANAHGIILKTYNELLSELMDFDYYLTDLIHQFEGSPLEYLYVEQDFIPEGKMEKVNSFQFIEQWLKYPDRKLFALLGDYGTGKTSFARKLAYKMAVNYKKAPGEVRLPFLVDLYQCRNTSSLQSLILEQLKNAQVEPVNAEIFLKLLAEGKILLIFDAFDEMTHVSNAEITLNNFRQLNQAVIGEAKVILTSRTHYLRDNDEADNIIKKQGSRGLTEGASVLYREISKKLEYEIVYLGEFSDLQIKKYLQKALAEKWEHAYNKIRSIYNLNDLSSRPVLLDMIVKILPKIEVMKDFFNVSDLYRVFTYSWLEREAYRLQMVKEEIQNFVEELAYKLWSEKKERLHYTELADVLKLHFGIGKKAALDLSTADYSLRTASFLVRDGKGNYGFAHKSFQEFFIARRIKRRIKKKRKEDKADILDLRPLSIEIIFFLKYLIADNEKIIELASELLAGPYRKNISENALLLFYLIIKMNHLNQRFFPENIEIQRDKRKNFQKVIQDSLPRKLNLQSAVLNESRFPDMVFSNADFSEALLNKSFLTHCVFKDVVFTGAQFNGTEFSGSVFKKVQFKKTHARNCNFKNCEFIECVLKKADFSYSNFLTASFKNCTFENNNFTGSKHLSSDFAIDMK
jgi:MinD-like ATPase involved in chromosome partitioning or flagellar assembly